MVLAVFSLSNVLYFHSKELFFFNLFFIARNKNRIILFLFYSFLQKIFSYRDVLLGPCFCLYLQTLRSVFLTQIFADVKKGERCFASPPPTQYNLNLHAITNSICYLGSYAISYFKLLFFKKQLISSHLSSTYSRGCETFPTGCLMLFCRTEFSYFSFIGF